jgi:predicted DNA-binding protein (MmcQ/YjbR family)
VPAEQATLDAEDIAALTRIREICASFAGVEEAQLQDRPLFRVGRRRFAIFNGNGSPSRPRWARCGRSLHFLADALDLDALRQDPRFAPSPHHGDRRWMFLSIDSSVIDWSEIAELLDSAYQQVTGPQTRR